MRPGEPLLPCSAQPQEGQQSQWSELFPASMMRKRPAAHRRMNCSAAGSSAAQGLWGQLRVSSTLCVHVQGTVQAVFCSRRSASNQAAMRAEQWAPQGFAAGACLTASGMCVHVQATPRACWNSRRCASYQGALWVQQWASRDSQLRNASNSPRCVRACAGDQAGFLEQQALRSLAGGNVAAAVHRLGLCKEALLQECRASGYTPELCCRLGDVIGTQVRQRARTQSTLCRTKCRLVKAREMCLSRIMCT